MSLLCHTIILNHSRVAALIVLIIASAPFSGCTSLSTRPDQPAAIHPAPLTVQDVAHLPLVRIPGAKPADVRSLAMGAARSKGWRLLDSGGDRLVLERALDPGSPLAQSLDPVVQTAPAGSRLEVTTHFLNQGSELIVASAAELVMPPLPVAEGTQRSTTTPSAPRRLDQTAALRPSLTQSLAALQTTWSEHAERLANAAPPIAEPVAPSAAPAPEVATSTPERALVDQSTADTDTHPASTSAPAPTRSVSPRPAPELRPAAPVIDATAQLSAPAANELMRLPVNPTPAPAIDLNTRIKHVAQTLNCAVSTGGIELIDSRRDGDVFRVRCDGGESLLLHCQDGSCRSLL